MEQFSREELAERSGASIEYVDRLVGLGILDRRPDSPQFTVGDVRRVRFVHSLEQGGLSGEGLATAVTSGDLSLAFLDSPAWQRFGSLARSTYGEVLATTIPDATMEWTEGRPEHPEWREALAEVHTSFAEFPAELCERLLYRGWWLAGATLSRYHRSFLPTPLPTWRGLG